MKKTLTKLDYTPYMYEDKDTHTVRISNTIKSLTLVGNKQGLNNNLKSQLVEVANIGSNVEELGPYCFAGCTKLLSVYIPGNVRLYGENCMQSVTGNIDSPVTRGDIVFSIDKEAFAGTNIESVCLALSGRNIIDPADEENGYQGCKSTEYANGPYIGNGAFKNCKQLKKVVIAEHPEIGVQMFQGCSMLSSVNILSNYGSCAGDYAFADCTNLPSITFPENWEIVSKHMFDGCTNLTAVNFSNSENTKLIDIEDSAFNKCSNLTALTLPKNITSLMTLSQNAFVGSNLKLIHFSGIPSSEFDKFKSQDEKYVVAPVDTTTNSNFKYGIWYKNHLKNIFKQAWDNHAPIFWKMCGVGCGICTMWDKNVFNTKAFQEETSKRPYFFSEILYRDPALDSDEYDFAHKLVWDNFEGSTKAYANIKYPEEQRNTFVLFWAIWNKPDGTIVAHRWRGDGSGTMAGSSTKSIFERLDKWFSGYQPEDKFRGSNYTPAQYVAFDGWGLDHNCQLKSSDNEIYTFDATGNIIVKGTSGISQLQQQRSTNYGTANASQTRVITVSLDYSGTNHSKLTGMTADSNDLEAKLSSYTNNITKLVNSQATVNAVKAAITDAVEDENCKLLIFHFSGHGSGGSNGKSSMVLYNGNLADSAFWKLIETAKCRVFCIFACCHAGTMFKASLGDNEQPINFQEVPDFGKSAIEYFNGAEMNGICAASNTPNLLVWSACTDGEVSWMYEPNDVDNGMCYRTGHCMIAHILKNYDANMTYRQLWSKIPAEEQYFYANGKPYIYNGKEVFVHPQLTELGQSFQDFKVFT